MEPGRYEEDEKQTAFFHESPWKNGSFSLEWHVHAIFPARMVEFLLNTSTYPQRHELRYGATLIADSAILHLQRR